MIESQIYDKYKGQITVAYKDEVKEEPDGNARVYAKRTQERETHTFNGFSEGDNIVLIECPYDCLAIEFEDSRDKNLKSIRETEMNCITLGLDYCIADHGGTSPYLYLFGLKIKNDADALESKKALAKKIVPKDSWKMIDRTNFGRTLIPIIDRPHWKPKYRGTIHKILRGKLPMEHNNDISRLLDVEIEEKTGIIKEAPAEKQPIPKHIEEKIKLGEPKGNRHLGIWQLTRDLFYLGYNEEEIITKALEMNSNSIPPKPEYVVTNHVKYLFRNQDRALKKNLTDKEIAEIYDKIKKEKFVASDFKVYPNPRNAESIADVEVKWVVDKMIPTGLTLIAGQPGVGKSWIGCELVRAVTTDKNFCGQWESEKGIAIYIDLEGELTETKRRMKRVLSEINKDVYFDDNCSLDYEYIEKLISRYKQLENDKKIKLIVIDTLISAHKMKENAAEEMEAVFHEALFPLKEAFPEAAIILIHHIKKPNAIDDRWTFFRGSGNILAKVRSGYLVFPFAAENGIVLECAKLRVGKSPDKALIRINDKENNEVDVTFVKNIHGNLNESRVEKCANNIVELLKDSDSTWSKNMIAENYKDVFDERIVTEALGGLVKKGYILRERKGHFTYNKPISSQTSL